MRILAIALLAFLAACTPANTETSEPDSCADERAQRDAAIDRLETLVNDWTPKHSEMKERVARGELISADEISAFEAAQSEYADSLFSGEAEISELMAQIDAGCKD